MPQPRLTVRRTSMDAKLKPPNLLQLGLNLVAALAIALTSALAPLSTVRGQEAAQSTSQDWPQLGHDPQRTNSTDNQVDPPYCYAWKWYEVPIASRIQPVVASGRLFIGSLNGFMYARDATSGAPLWTYATGGPIRASAAVSEGTVVFGSHDGFTYGVSAADGNLLWRTKTGASATAPLIDPTQQQAYVASTDGHLTAVSITSGMQIWSVDLGSPILTSPSLSLDGSIIYVGTEAIEAVAVQAANGSEAWVTPLQGQSLADRYPVVTASSVTYRSQPIYFFHDLLHEGDDVMDQAGSLDPDWSKDWSRVEPEILSYLSSDPSKQTYFTLDATTGVSLGTAPILYTYGNNDNANTPVIRNGQAYVTYRARHGIQTDGGSVHVTSEYDAELGRMNLVDLSVEGLRASESYNNQFRMTSDEPAVLTMGGNLLLVDNWERLGGLNVQSGSLVHIGAVSNDWPECGVQCGPGTNNPFFPLSGSSSDPAYPFPSPRVNEGHVRGGAVIANDMIYWRVIEGGLAGIRHQPSGGCGSPQVWTSTDGTPPLEEPNPPQPPTTPRNLSEYVYLDLTAPVASPPSDLVDRLEQEVGDIVSSGDHLMPLFLVRGMSESQIWPYNTTNPPGPPSVNFRGSGNEYWQDPGELLYTLALSYPYLSSSLQDLTLQYVQASFERYPPLEDLPWSGTPWLREGTARESYQVPYRSELNNWPPPAANLSALYALWLWSKNTGDWSYAQGHWNQITSLFNARKGSLVYYADIAGAIGYARLADHFGNTAAYQAAANAVVSAMQDGRDFTTFQARAAADYPDPRGQQTGLSAPVLFGLTPEIGLYLQEQTQGDAQSHLLDLEAGDGLRWWYLTRAGDHGEVGETSFLAPSIAWSHFLGHAYLLGDSEAELRKWLDRPFALGDLYSIQKIVATIQAHVPEKIPSGRISKVELSSTEIDRYTPVTITFDVDTQATQLDLPYDSDPPAGLDPGQGITVEGLFSKDGFGSTIVQPAFFEQPYNHTVVGGRDHFVPSGPPHWTIRFTAPSSGVWQVRLRVRDSEGTDFFPAKGPSGLNFTVRSNGSNPYQRHGFLGVSAQDPRYFVFDDGTPFVGVGFNDGFQQSADVEARMQAYEQNKMNFMRVWLSGDSINGSQWSSWSSHHLPNDNYLPGVQFDVSETYEGSDVSMRLDDSNPCLFSDFAQGGIPVEPNQDYQVEATVKVSGVTGPNSSGPYGFTIRVADWQGVSCAQGGAGTLVTAPLNGTSGWTTVSGTYHTTNGQMWLNYLYLARENATGGSVYIDDVRVWRADDPDQVNILREPNANSHMYFDPMSSAKWDLFIQSAEQHGVYLKLVIDEKNEWIRDHIAANGQMTTSGSNDNFYAGANTKVRWLQEAWWRYLIARWGYSTAIHSFEYINEGDPYDGKHYAAASAMATYFDSHDPAHHMVTTSFWHSFPNKEFWSNPAYSAIDYADLHAYISTGWGQSATFLSDSLLETRPAYVFEGQASAHLPGTSSIDQTIVPRGLVIQGQGEWTIRYQMKAEGLSANCPYDTSGSMARVRWQIDGGPFNGGREGVAPANQEGKDFICTSPAGSFGWTEFSSRYDRENQQVPEDYRLVLSDNNPHELSLSIENSNGTSGDAWIDSVQVIDPAGRVSNVIGEFQPTRMDEDAAWYNAAYGEIYGGSSVVGGRQPLVRGETGIDTRSQQEVNPDLSKDKAGVWLHNNLWGQINPGGMYDLFWWASETIPASFFKHFLTFRNFMDGIPLTNGHYHGVEYTAANSDLRVWGQRDDLSGRLHLWVQNNQHTWRNVVDGVSIAPIDSGFTLLNMPDGDYEVEWWDTYATSGPVFHTETVGASDGKLALSLPEALTADVAVKIRRIGGGAATPTPFVSATPTSTAMATDTPTPTETALVTSSPTASSTSTSEPSPTPSPTASLDGTITPGPATATPAASATITVTATSQPTALSPTPGEGPTATPTLAFALEDVNADGRIDIVDVQLAINVFLGTEVDPSVVSRADVNQDGSVDILDVQRITNIFLAG